jgi:hypothetical protein
MTDDRRQRAEDSELMWEVEKRIKSEATKGGQVLL